MTLANKTLPVSGDIHQLRVYATASGDNVLVAGVDGKRITLDSACLSTNTGQMVEFKSGSNGMYPFFLGVGGGHDLKGKPQLNEGESLILNLATASVVAGYITYIL